MKKVVAFLEKYAEWVAMSFACIFLLYMVYSYVVSPDDLRVDVGGKELLPGDVDTHINTTAAAPLDIVMNDPHTDITFPVPEFRQQFALAMSKERRRMDPEFVQGNSFRPTIPGVGPVPIPPEEEKKQITELPIPPTVVWTFSNQGNSVVGVAPPVIAGAAVPAVAPPLNKVEKNWIMCEGKIDNKALAAAWKKSLFDDKGNLKVPADVLLTHFLRVEIERQEQIDPEHWAPAVPVAPLAIAEIKDYPKEGDRPGEEDFRLWAEKHQVDIVEPTFYPLLHGDEWYIPSLRDKDKDPAAAANAVKEGPFDPANPPNRPLTTEEKQQVYKYNLKQKQEKEKADAQQRKSKMDANRKPGTTTGGAGNAGEGQRRRIGGYAPLPTEGQRYDDAGRPIGRPAGRPAYPRDGRMPGRETPGRYVNPNPMIQNGAIQNQALSQPFDPTTLALVDGKGNAAGIILWINDDSITPGKTYRYRVKVLLKNPIYNTQGLTKNPKFETQLAVASDWSDWTEVKAPSNTEFYFSRALQPINGKAVTSVNVDVFKREKGDWYQGTFTIGPGDSIGSVKNKMDFTTGMTLIDIRPDTREKDLKILVSDESGNIRVISFQSQLVDPLYATLKEKVKAAAAAGPAADAGNPSLINPIGTR